MWLWGPRGWWLCSGKTGLRMTAALVRRAAPRVARLLRSFPSPGREGLLPHSLHALLRFKRLQFSATLGVEPRPG